jgi:hypothetical protein
MRFGFFGTRGVNEFLNEAGQGIFFTLRRGAQEFDRFFPNVGQPNQDPPRHPRHKDDPAVNSEITLGRCWFKPFYAEYRLLGSNRFEWLECDGGIRLRAVLNEPVRFHAVGRVAAAPHGFAVGSRFFVSGLELEKEYRGEIEASISSEPDHPAPGGGCFGAHAADFWRGRAFNPALASVFYNLSISPELKNKFYVPVNKVWPGFLADIFDLKDARQGPLIFGWDGAFASVILADFEIELAKINLLSTLEAQTAAGRIPQIRMGRHITDRTNPPIWFIAAWRIFEASGDLAFLQAVYPALLRNYRWFKRSRRNSDGTFSWGTDSADDGGFTRAEGKAEAVLETGLDDSPLFDEMALQGPRLNYACIDLTALLCRACEILRAITKLAAPLSSEQQADAAELEQDLAWFQSAMRAFFAPGARIANSYRLENGHPLHARELTPLSFYPLLTPALSPAQQGTMRELFYSKHFSGEHLLPSLSFLSAHFNGDGDYWRGRIWPPLVYLAAQGFKRYLPEIYAHIKEYGRALLEAEWLRHGHVHENYSSITGQGEPRPGTYARSCPLYSWGGLLGVI